MGFLKKVSRTVRRKVTKPLSRSLVPVARPVRALAPKKILRSVTKPVKHVSRQIERAPKKLEKTAKQGLRKVEKGVNKGLSNVVKGAGNLVGDMFSSLLGKNWKWYALGAGGLFVTLAVIKKPSGK